VLEIAESFLITAIDLELVMKLEGYLTSVGGLLTYALIMINSTILVIYTIVLFLVMNEFDSGISSFIICIVAILSGFFLLIVPFVTETKMYLVTISASISGICTITLGILSLIPALDLGRTVFTILQFVIGALVLVFTVLAHWSYVRKTTPDSLPDEKVISETQI
jgi:hypothetical protein